MLTFQNVRFHRFIVSHSHTYPTSPTHHTHTQMGNNISNDSQLYGGTLESMWFTEKCSLPKSITKVMSYLELTAGTSGIFNRVPTLLGKKRKKMSTKNMKDFDSVLKTKIKKYKYEMLQGNGPSFFDLVVPSSTNEIKHEDLTKPKSKNVVVSTPIRSSLATNRPGFKFQQQQEEQDLSRSSSIHRRESEGLPMMIHEEEKQEDSGRFTHNHDHVAIAALLLSDFLCELRVPLLSTSFYEQFAVAQKRQDKLMMRALCSSLQHAHAFFLKRLVRLFRILLEPRFALRSGLSLDIVIDKFATKLGDKPVYEERFDVRHAQQVLADMILEYDTLFTKNTSHEFKRLEAEQTRILKLNHEFEKRVRSSDTVKRALAEWAGERRVKSNVFQRWKREAQRNRRQRLIFQKLAFRAQLSILNDSVREKNARIAALEDRVQTQNRHLKRVDDLLQTLRLPTETTGLFNSVVEEEAEVGHCTVMDNIKRAASRSRDLQSIIELRAFDRTLQNKYYKKIMKRREM